MDTNIILGTSGVIIGILGLISGYIFYQRSLKYKEPTWSIKSNNLISGYSKKFKNLKIQYNNNVVEKLTVSKLLFMNAGRETINRDDIAKANRLRVIPIKETQIVDAKVDTCNNESSQFSVNISNEDKCAYIDFDYLDHNQGAVFQIIHTGVTSNDIQILGDIKGAKNSVITKIDLDPLSTRWEGLEIISNIISIIGFILVLITFTLIVITNTYPQYSITFDILPVILGVVLLAVLIVAWKRKLFQKKNVSKDLHKSLFDL